MDYNLVYDYDGARPAFNLNPESISFAAETSAGQYKLTLQDTSLSVMTTGDAVRYGKKVTVSFSTAGNPTQVSVMMINGEWSDGTEAKYYGKLDDSGSFTLPDSYDTSWKTWLIAEKVNDGNATNYAGSPVEITIPDKSEQTVTAPTAVSPLTYTGSTQTLVTAAEVTDGNTDAGSISYSLDNNTWSTALPQGTDA